MEEMEAGVEFDLLEVGVEGKIALVPKQKIAPTLPLQTLPVGLPPVLPTMKEELEDHLSHPEKLPIHDLYRSQKFWSREINARNLYSVDVTPVQTTIVVDRNTTTGELLGFKEQFIPDTGSSAKNSTSLRRPPGPPDQSVKGSSTNYPFWPGGLEEPNLDKLGNTNETALVDFNKDLSTCPPGFESGMTFKDAAHTKVDEIMKTSTPGVLTLADIMSQGDEIDIEDDHDKEQEQQQEQSVVSQKGSMNKEAEAENIDDLVQGDIKREPIKLTTVTTHPKEEWAVMVDINKPVANFHKRIPCMAREWPFELDVFQKQAILHLESHDCVFVAAHTSAGKTVVAEYAIALSLRHMTRTVYTSPIKALSNQKFRDFKNTFEDVGLITGDVQIKPEASCLIMTTEILRSMLYNGSDVIRDLEWVIFDEVHYINDAERGVVWEEVLIMLPQHVNIILLSATVPNTMEFAAWVGRIKKKKVYVVSTQKRPVPLEHFLYTGNSSKTSNELFLLMDSNKNFLTDGYNKAANAKRERGGKSGQGYGPKNAKGAGGFQQEKNIWLSMIEMLRKKDKLPIVAFTFSRKKIDDNAHNLSSLDLTTQSEKSEVHLFFNKSIGKLKGTDRDLPQVKGLQDLLKRGVGIHHSGILPILKEVVEMLFHRGLVKILFATETFAMGVNMPARTVVFDSIRKHDGTNFRDLLPGEYIQMAGRAGRRGLDTTGTVIILCKGDMPEMADLHKMMLGKPTLLQSQFRLTYSMILNILRVEQLRVEDMMKKSFSEFHSQKDMAKHKDRLKEIAEKIQNLPEVLDYSGDLEVYYKACDEYWELRQELQDITMTHPHAIKACSPGRVIVVSQNKHQNVLGVVLKSSSSSKERSYDVLVIIRQQSADSPDTNQSSSTQNTDCDLTFPKPYSASRLFHPEGPCGHTLLKLTAENISVITTKVLKISADKILDDFRKRQQPRFRHDPPGQSTSVATQELLRLTEANPAGLPGLDPVKDLGIRDIELVERFRRLHLLQQAFIDFRCVHDPSFNDNFKQLKSNMKIQDEYRKLQFLLSDESLQLLPEYQQRIDVLRGLKYVDDSKTVKLKGRVACEMSQHELIITELVFENVLTDLHPYEIAAVLSCVVFEQKRCSEPNLTPELEQAKERFLKIAEEIGVLQRECGLHVTVDDYLSTFQFGLMEVVFEWARGLPFSEITQLTDIQEGIIVRCIQRLDEVLKDVRNAARIIGDPTLYQKMEEASTAVKRDIVFAASLYTQ